MSNIASNPTFLEQTGVISTWQQLAVFLDTTFEAFGDPASGVCLLLVPWRAGVPVMASADPSYFAAWHPQKHLAVLYFANPEGMDALHLRIARGLPEMREGKLDAFQAVRISPGVWALNPSLHIPGQLHAFVVMHGVPEPAPWENLIEVVPG